MEWIAYENFLVFGVNFGSFDYLVHFHFRLVVSLPKIDTEFNK